jgi:hypothetical protein
MTAQQDAFARICERMQALMAEKPGRVHAPARPGDLIRRIGDRLDHRQAA